MVKFAQILSVRPDIVGAEMAATLGKLRDHVPPFSEREARQKIQNAFGRPVEECFETFDPNPVAAASIAQVHRAITKEGKEVAVKILRPNIEKKFARDLRFFECIARAMECFPQWKRLRPRAVVDHFRQTVRKELDLRLEAAAADALRENAAGDAFLHIPAVEWGWTARQVLTLEWVEGISIHDTEALSKAGHDLKTLAEHLAVSFFNQAFRDGLFHADIHPGNLFVDTKGRIVLVDFGIMGTLDEDTRLYVAEIIRGFLTRDYEAVARAHFEAGYVPAHHSLQDFALACRAIGEPIIGRPAEEISVARLLEQLFQVTKQFDMQTQPQLLLLQKTMMLMEGVGAMLHPKVNVWQLAEPWIEEWARKNLSKSAQIKRVVQGLIRRAERALTPHAAPPTVAEHSAAPSAQSGLRLYGLKRLIWGILLGVLLALTFPTLQKIMILNREVPEPIMPFG